MNPKDQADEGQCEPALDTQSINSKIADSAERIDLKLQAKFSEFQARVFEQQLRILDGRLDILKLLAPVFVMFVILLTGLQFFSETRFNEFKAEVRGESDEQPVISLYGLDKRPLDGQTALVTRVTTIYHAPNGARYAKERYDYSFTILVRKQGRGTIKAKNTVLVFYSNSSNPEAPSDDPRFNNFNTSEVNDQDPLVKVGHEIFFPFKVNTGTFDRPSPGATSKFMIKILYGDRTVSSVFDIKFSPALRFVSYDMP